MTSTSLINLNSPFPLVKITTVWHVHYFGIHPYLKALWVGSTTQSHFAMASASSQVATARHFWSCLACIPYIPPNSGSEVATLPTQFIPPSGWSPWLVKCMSRPWFWRGGGGPACRYPPNMLPYVIWWSDQGVEGGWLLSYTTLTSNYMTYLSGGGGSDTRSFYNYVPASATLYILYLVGRVLFWGPGS